MRGMMTKLTIGERVAWYRRRRGMSQEVLAGLVGRTPDWLGKIENNRIELDRLSVIKSLADVLDVALSDLLAEPSLLDWTSETGLETVPALRAALMDYRGITALGGGDMDVEPPNLSELRSETSGLWEAYQGSRFGLVTHRLPALLKHAQAAVFECEGKDRDEARHLLGLTYQLAATQLTKLGETDLAWVAAERGLSAVRPTGDPVIAGSLFRSVSHALNSTGRYADAVRLTNDAAGYLDHYMSDATPELLSVYGTLLLAGSVAAARGRCRNNSHVPRCRRGRGTQVGSRCQSSVDCVRSDQRRHSPGRSGRRARRHPGRHRPRPARRHGRDADGAASPACAGGVAGVQRMEPAGGSAVHPPARRTDGAGAGSPPLPRTPARAHMDPPAAHRAIRRACRSCTSPSSARLIRSL